LHRVVVVRDLATLRAVVAGARALAMRLRGKVLELVVPLVRVRAAAEAVALAVEDVVHVCFRAHTRFA
jgi:hypothetical protein